MTIPCCDPHSPILAMTVGEYDWVAGNLISGNYSPSVGLRHQDLINAMPNLHHVGKERLSL